MGEKEERVVFVYLERAGVMMRGEVLRKWCEEGMRQKVNARSVSVKVSGFVFT